MACASPLTAQQRDAGATVNVARPVDAGIFMSYVGVFSYFETRLTRALLVNL